MAKNKGDAMTEIENQSDEFIERRLRQRYKTLEQSPGKIIRRSMSGNVKPFTPRDAIDELDKRDKDGNRTLEAQEDILAEKKLLRELENRRKIHEYI